MMIVGFAVTAGTAAHFLDPFSPERLVAVTSVVALIAAPAGTLPAAPFSRLYVRVFGGSSASFAVAPNANAVKAISC